MDSGRKKRKMGNKEEEEEDDDDDEDDKVEKFFALIRSTREMRDRLKNVPNRSKEEDEMKKQEKKPVPAVWNPTFRPEDFMEDSKPENINNPLQPEDKDVAAGPSSLREQEEQETKEEGDRDRGLDLKLSL